MTNGTAKRFCLLPLHNDVASKNESMIAVPQTMRMRMARISAAMRLNQDQQTKGPPTSTQSTTVRLLLQQAPPQFH